jgi:hypothetical protein
MPSSGCAWGSKKPPKDEKKSKFERCVVKVMGKGHTKSSAYAICTDSVLKGIDGYYVIADKPKFDDLRKSKPDIVRLKGDLRKSHVKAHTRKDPKTGKIIQVKDYDDARTKKAEHDEPATPGLSDHIQGFVSQAASRIMRGDHDGANWVYFHVMSADDGKDMDRDLVRIKDPISFEPGPMKGRFDTLVRRELLQMKGKKEKDEHDHPDEVLKRKMDKARYGRPGHGNNP